VYRFPLHKVLSEVDKDASDVFREANNAFNMILSFDCREAYQEIAKQV